MEVEVIVSAAELPTLGHDWAVRFHDGRPYFGHKRLLRVSIYDLRSKIARSPTQ